MTLVEPQQVIFPVPVELLVLPDEVPDFLLHRRWRAVYEATSSFFDARLK
jgi:hypothetical protein